MLHVPAQQDGAKHGELLEVVEEGMTPRAAAE
jgi:hypothetical protein